MYGVQVCGNCPARKGRYRNAEPAFIRPVDSQLSRRLTSNIFKIAERRVEVEVLDDEQHRVAKLLLPEQSMGGEIKSTLSECQGPESLLGIKVCGAVMHLEKKYEDNQ